MNGNPSSRYANADRHHLYSYFRMVLKTEPATSFALICSGNPILGD
jgi:hypothetical protein